VLLCTTRECYNSSCLTIFWNIQKCNITCWIIQVFKLGPSLQVKNTICQYFRIKQGQILALREVTGRWRDKLITSSWYVGQLFLNIIWRRREGGRPSGRQNMHKDSSDVFLPCTFYWALKQTNSLHWTVYFQNCATQLGHYQGVNIKRVEVLQV
jgi:hypothetical protein